MPELMFFRRGVEALRVSLEHRRMVLGRAEPCDVVIPDPQVSRQQVALHFDGTRCVLEDLSGQGTRVNGEPMKHGELRDGSCLELGQWRALFRQQGSDRDEGPTRTGASTDVQPLGAQKNGLPPAQVRVRQGTTEFLHELGEDTLTIGKAADNALVLRDRFVSSHHLRVTRSETGIHVRDLCSTNGTFHNGARLVEAELALNSVLKVGETELVLEPVDPGEQRPPHGLIGNAPAVRQLVERLQRVAPSSALVTLLGESGTGKELVAKALHDSSPRASRPFLPINCAALSPALMESELFGHEKGAFTGADSKRKGAFEAAQGGTLFGGRSHRLSDEAPVAERPHAPLLHRTGIFTTCGVPGAPTQAEPHPLPWRLCSGREAAAISAPPRGSGEGERGAPGSIEAGNEEGADSASGLGRAATKDLRVGCVRLRQVWTRRARPLKPHGVEAQAAPAKRAKPCRAPEGSAARAGCTPRGCAASPPAWRTARAAPINSPPRPLRSCPHPPHGLYPAYTPHGAVLGQLRPPEHRVGVAPVHLGAHDVHQLEAVRVQLLHRGRARFSAASGGQQRPEHRAVSRGQRGEEAAHGRLRRLHLLLGR